MRNILPSLMSDTYSSACSSRELTAIVTSVGDLHLSVAGSVAGRKWSQLLPGAVFSRLSLALAAGAEKLTDTQVLQVRPFSLSVSQTSPGVAACTATTPTAVTDD